MAPLTLLSLGAGAHHCRPSLSLDPLSALRPGPPPPTLLTFPGRCMCPHPPRPSPGFPAALRPFPVWLKAGPSCCRPLPIPPHPRVPLLVSSAPRGVTCTHPPAPPSEVCCLLCSLEGSEKVPICLVTSRERGASSPPPPQPGSFSASSLASLLSGQPPLPARCSPPGGSDVSLGSGLPPAIAGQTLTSGETQVPTCFLSPRCVLVSLPGVPLVTWALAEKPRRGPWSSLSSPPAPDVAAGPVRPASTTVKACPLSTSTKPRPGHPHLLCGRLVHAPHGTQL